jgi:hypothetical protein
MSQLDIVNGNHLAFRNNTSLFEAAIKQVPSLSILNDFEEGSFIICGGFALHMLYGTDYSDVDVLFVSNNASMAILKENAFKLDESKFEGGYGPIYVQAKEPRAWPLVEFVEVLVSPDEDKQEALVKYMKQFDLTICMRGFNKTLVWEPVWGITYRHPVLTSEDLETTRARVAKYEMRINALEGIVKCKLYNELKTDAKLYEEYNYSLWRKIVNYFFMYF